MARSLQRISRELVARRSAAKRALAENGDSNRATAVTGNATGRASKCEPYRELIEAKLEPWLDAGRIREDLIKDRGFAASYSSIGPVVFPSPSGCEWAGRSGEAPPGASATSVRPLRSTRNTRPGPSSGSSRRISRSASGS